MSRPFFTHKHTNLTVGERAEIDDKMAAQNSHLRGQDRHWPHIEWQKIATLEYRVIPGNRNWQIETADLDVRLDV